MLEVKFYDNVDDRLLKFAVLFLSQMVNGYFVSIRTEILMKYQADIEKKMNRF